MKLTELLCSNCEADIPKYAKYPTLVVYTSFFLLEGRQQHGVACQSLCGSEVTRKIKQLEVEGARAPAPHSWRRQIV